MADTKITALTAITTVDPAVDVLPIVDVSDTTMAASGTTKKITSNQILGAGGTATLASATISGDLTVDTSTLKVDSANNRVGIGTASPAVSLDVIGNFNLGATSAVNGAYQEISFPAGAYKKCSIRGYSAGTTDAGELRFYTAPAGDLLAERYKIDSTGVATWSNVGGVAGTAMTLNSTGLGVGVTPTIAKVQTNGAFLTTGAVGSLGTTPTANALILDYSSACRIIGTGANTTTAGVLKFINASSNASVYLESMTLDASGRLLVNTTGVSSAEQVSITASAAGYQCLYLNNSAASQTGTFIVANSVTAATSSFSFADWYANGVAQFRVSGNGVIYAQNTAVQSISDVRLKENISNATDGLDVITALRPVRYDWKAGFGNERKQQLGFIAQEVQAVFADAVGDWELNGETYKTVGPSALIPVLVKAIQELTARVQTLEAR